MPFSLSPSVEFQETDLTTTVRAVATSIGASVGQFAWGPVDEINLVDSEDTLKEKFSTPDASTYKDWFSVANFLAYSNNSKIIRVVEATALNAGDTAGILVKNETDYTDSIVTINASSNTFIAKYPGVYGNDIVVDVADSSNFTGWDYENNFDYAPTGTELWVAVLKGGDLVEKFYTDTTAGTKDYQGNAMYSETVINTQSRYIWIVMNNLDVAINGQIYTMILGADGAAIGDAERQLGWDMFSNADDIDINLPFAGGASAVTSKYMLDNVTSTRLDCVGFVSPQQSAVVGSATPEADIVTDRLTYSSTSYGHYDGNYKYQYDKYNDVYRWLPLNGDCAGIYARTDRTNDAWWSGAGHNRGQVKNVTKLAFSPSKAQRDELYKNSINPIVNIAGEGPLLYGDKTMLIKPSAFGYMNVRRLFIVLEKAISTASKYSLFEFNDAFTQNQFRNMVVPFLRDVQSRRGVYDFLVIADSRVNTSEVIDRGEFKSDIYIKPSRSIQNIYLNFIATKSGVVFEELVVGE